MPHSMARSPQLHTEGLIGQSFHGRGVHLIGVGGAGMRALAGVLLDSGARVSGSDTAPSAALDELAAEGASIAIGQRGQNVPVDCDLAVYSAAIHEQNPEMVAARERGIEVVKYSQMLGRLMSQRVGVAVAGTHGKSTTTAMVAHALRAAGLDPSFIVGAVVDQLGGPSGVGDGRHFVVEACEFDRSFLNLWPRYAAILNVEEDHLDCYANLSAIVEAFRAFAAQVDPSGVLIVNGEDRNALAAARSARCQVETFGLAESCVWRATDLTAERGLRSFQLSMADQSLCRVSLRLPGQHSLYNALAAAALLRHAGLTTGQIAESLGGFLGARRRMTLKGTAGGVTVVDDYAHHPTEIQVTLRALREFYQPERVVCVFQPHQLSRTRFLMKDFARSFAAADEVIVPDIYFVRDSDLERDCVRSQDLVAQIRLNGGSAEYMETFEAIVDRLGRTLRPGDLAVTMGAGNVWEIADEVVCRLG